MVSFTFCLPFSAFLCISLQDCPGQNCLHLQFLLDLMPANTNCSLYLIQTILFLTCGFSPEAYAQHESAQNVDSLFKIEAGLSCGICLGAKCIQVRERNLFPWLTWVKSSQIQGYGEHDNGLSSCVNVQNKCGQFRMCTVLSSMVWPADVWLQLSRGLLLTLLQRWGGVEALSVRCLYEKSTPFSALGRSFPTFIDSYLEDHCRLQTASEPRLWWFMHSSRRRGSDRLVSIVSIWVPGLNCWVTAGSPDWKWLWGSVVKYEQILWILNIQKLICLFHVFLMLANCMYVHFIYRYI